MSEVIDAKNLIDVQRAMMVCTYCGFCKSVCPVFEDLGWDSSVARGKVILSYGLLQKEIPADQSVVEAIYQCTTCKDCERRCPSSIEVVEIVERCRRDLVESGLILPKHRRVVGRILEFGNPYGESRGVPETLGQEPRKAKVGYFVGCTSAYRNREIAEAMLRLLQKMGVDFTLLDETCCGSVMQRVGWGEEDLVELMRKNISAIEETGVEEVVFSCAGCYKMFKEEYPRFVDFDFSVRHVSELLADWQPEMGPLSRTITYHDPCHLGRHCGVYEPPRSVLRSIPGAEFKEMPRKGETARCCGGGGGVRSAFPELSADISAGRVEEAEIADILVTTCPFCVNNLRLGKEKRGSKIEIVDLVELVESLLK